MAPNPQPEDGIEQVNPIPTNVLRNTDNALDAIKTLSLMIRQQDGPEAAIETENVRSIVTFLAGIETLTLVESQGTPDGLRTIRRKGSRDNVVEWTPRLRAAQVCGLHHAPLWKFLLPAAHTGNIGSFFESGDTPWPASPSLNTRIRACAPSQLPSRSSTPR